ncbi:MAG: type IX secretion system sortase PorU [Raineya sp.]|jgi:hypothetical protein|nr:type IX secretion system sortase PorU [Raineya sp.]
MRYFIFVFYFIVYQSFAQNSVLSSGNWYKIAITESGMHKLTAQNLRDLGINIDEINPKNIAIYGNGGGMLPQANNITRITDLQENSILVAGEEDGRFNDSDYILFYAQGANKWTYNASNQRFIHEKNLYDDKNYYFITIKNSQGLRIQTQNSVAGATQTLNTFDEYFFHEKDEKNILSQIGRGGSGREWYGEFFNGSNQVQVNNYNVEGIVAGSNIIFTSSVLSQAFSTSTFQVNINGNTIGTHNLSAIIDATYASKGAIGLETFVINSNQIPQLPQLNVTYTYSQQGTGTRGYLNYFRVQYEKQLQLYGNQTKFQSVKSLSAGISNFTVGNTDGNSRIWDITNPLNPVNQNYNLNGNQAVFGANTNTLKEFIVWQGIDFPSPQLIGAMDSQNLKAFNPANLIIITHPNFREQSEQLASFRRNYDKLSVVVVDVFQIYNEFSSGKQDVSALRDFVRHLYLKNPTEVKYLLLFGAASYDYKNRVTNNTNYIPIYESRESLHPIYSYSSDDYFGFMEATEGEWQETFNNVPTFDHTMEVAVGRIPARTAQEAQDVVDKLIHYTNKETLGSWRKNVVFLADDGDVNQHQSDADKLADKVEKDYTNYNIEKIYLDAFQQVSTGGSERSPSCKDAFTKAVEKGALIINYTGHGGEVGWTQEEVLRTPDIKTWKNNNHLPLMITATCEFGRYDEPTIISGAEVAVLQPKAGAIGLITTTRPVFSSTNFILNTQIYNAIFEPIAGKMPRLGDVMRLTKNNSLSGSINRNFSLLGDPSMRLAYPKENIVITKLNNKDILVSQDTLKALSKITIQGEIRDENNAVIPDFQGILETIIFDKIAQRTTLGTQSSPKFNYSTRENRLFNGKVTVKNGKFSFETIIPKDIAYAYGEGKISFYASDTTQNKDAGSGKDDIIVGGSATNPLADNTPPKIRLFMNDTTFVNGGLVGQNPILLAKLYDESGINISSAGVGHDITAYLNDSIASPRVLNNFYTADLDTYKSGDVRYQFKSLPNGNYTLTLKAWDTYNNSAEEKIDFIVASTPQMALRNVFNYPNPFSDKTTFSFEHNRFEEDLEIEIQIINSQGRKIWEAKKVLEANTSVVRQLEVVLKENGTDFANGVYIYRISVRSLKDNSLNTVTNRLVILKQ